MRKTLSTEISLFLLSIVCALMSVSAAWVHNDMQDRSFGMKEPFTRLEVSSLSDSHKISPKNIAAVQEYLSAHSLALLSASKLESQPSIVGYDPAHHTWFPEIKETQALAISGTYSAELWREGLINPYLSPQVKVSGTFTPPQVIKSDSIQLVEKLSQYALPIGDVAISTTDTEQIDEVTTLLKKLRVDVRTHKPVTLMSAILQNPAFIVTGTFYICGLVASILMWNISLNEERREIEIHYEYGGNAASISALRTRYQVIPLLISCLVGTLFALSIMSVSGHHALSHTEYFSLLVGGLSNLVILLVIYFVTGLLNISSLLYKSSLRK